MVDPEGAPPAPPPPLSFSVLKNSTISAQYALERTILSLRFFKKNLCPPPPRLAIPGSATENISAL